MTDREKLIALMREVDACICNLCDGSEEAFDHSEGILADHLLFNGVTFATDNNVGGKWIPVTERLPELIPCNAGTAYSEAVIAWTDGRKAMIAVWDGVDFLCAADYWEAWGENITHWMPLPEPPMRKGENDG